MSKLIHLRALDKDGRFVIGGGIFKHNVDISSNITGLSDFALACLQERKSSNMIIGFDNRNISRIRNRNAVMVASKACVLGVYISMYGNHKINLKQMVSEFNNKNGLFLDAINHFNSLFEGFSGRRLVDFNKSGKLAFAYLWVGLNAIADLIKESFAMREMGYFDKEILLNDYLESLGITAINIFRLLNDVKNADYEAAHICMSKHEITLQFTIAGNNIYINRPMQSENAMTAAPIQKDSLFFSSQASERVFEENTVSLDSLEKTPKPTNIQSTGVVSEARQSIHQTPSQVANQSPPQVLHQTPPVAVNSVAVDKAHDEKQKDHAESAPLEDIKTGGMPHEEIKGFTDDIEYGDGQPIETNDLADDLITHSAVELDEVQAPPLVDAAKTNVEREASIQPSSESHAPILEDNKTVIPRRPRTPITAGTTDSPLSDMDGKNNESAISADKAKVEQVDNKPKNPLFKGVGKSSINFDML